MKNELEVYRELKAIRARMAKLRANGHPYDVAYGAQQALDWMLGTGMAASDVLETIEAVTADLERQGVS